MNFVESIADAAKRTGYREEAVVRGYAFANVLDERTETLSVPLVAFTHTPPSYRTAAFAAVECEADKTFEVVKMHRALGAPILFVVSGNEVAVWQVRTELPPRVVERSTIDEIPQLFERNRDAWSPTSIHRAKSIGAADQTYQLDFVDIGLLPAIEGEVHTKLDRLLTDMLSAATADRQINGQNARQLFRVVFRLLAAKVLQDRGHPFASSFKVGNLRDVLRSIEDYYSLPSLSWHEKSNLSASYQAAWDVLRSSINFSNISSDDLAFVYENTLVTQDARKLFGTHSTPRQVAEYVVQRLELHKHEVSDLNIYEPFTGAGVFLVSALRHLRDALPISWSDQKRHDFLIKRLAGDEIDAFACEVATLSLILADYPNHNGWHIGEADLFGENILSRRMQSNNVILCNPPFEAFSDDEKVRYSVSNFGYSKPIAVLDAALKAKPLALGFVLPRPFILDRQYQAQRKKIEELYSSIELVELPDRIFGASATEASILIAKEPKRERKQQLDIRSTEIADRDRVSFLKNGVTTVQRHEVRQPSDSETGNLWIPALAELWTYLENNPILGKFYKVSRGIEWNYNQSEAASERKQEGFRKGYHNARRHRQFSADKQVWLDYREENLRGGFRQDWSRAKIVANAGRLSRGPWRIGAMLDLDGNALSQQFFGIWPKDETSTAEMLAVCALINGPVANAFLSVFSPAKGIRVSAVERIPLPLMMPTQLGEAVREYVDCLEKKPLLSSNDDLLETLLLQIDAIVLGAYDLPPSLERRLLQYFRDAERPVSHSWDHWDELIDHPGLRLAERLNRGPLPDVDWVRKVFRPLPDNEAALLRDYGG